MLKQLVFIFCILLSLIVSSQNEANNWYFGINAGITFNNGAPQALTDGALVTPEGCAAISDNMGNLLFYSDGISVWNRNHQVMANGADLLGNPSSTQSGLIVPHPGNQDLFYIFSLDLQAGPDGLRYSVVDMTLNSGLGDITSEKNVLLHTPSTEKITAVMHTNGNDIWVITHKANSNEFCSYLVTDTGLNTTPIITAIGHTPFNIIDSVGYMKISPDGSKLGVVYSGSELFEVLDFNTTTGILSNPLQFIAFTQSSTWLLYGLEFSPDSQLLYVSISEDGVYQYDISSNNQALIDASKTKIIPDFEPTLDFPHAALQLGPDGKIYVAHNLYTYLGAINSPNLIGNSADYIFDAVSLDGRMSLIGLPPFIQSFFNVAFQVNNLCLGEFTSFTANIPDTYDSLEWDFGDGSTSTDENPSHTYASAGDYNVTLTLTSGVDIAVDEQMITIYEFPIANPVSYQTICDDNNDGIEIYNLTQHVNHVLAGQDPDIFELEYYDSIESYNINQSMANPELLEVSTSNIANPVIRVFNTLNTDCETAFSFEIQVLEGANPSQTILPITTCDNTTFGTDTAGQNHTFLDKKIVSYLHDF